MNYGQDHILQAPKPAWQQLSRRFPGERDCLASFIALEAAEVIAGIKPANLVNISNKHRACGRNIYRLWKAHGMELAGLAGLEVCELADRGSSLLLLIYRRELLAPLLTQKKVRAILDRAGYATTADALDPVNELRERISSGSFPHEIGVFLGYPLKDVVGFMGWVRLPFSCQGPWKIYGNPAESLTLAEQHRQCRCRMARDLVESSSPLDCLRHAA